MLETDIEQKQFYLKLGIAFVATFVSICAAQWIAEKFFFDKFFYQKSVKFGYPLKNAHLKAYGKRSADILTLLDHPERLASSQGILTIAIIGDSYVWGQGLRNEDRFPVILEKKLNTIRKARVLSLALCGDSIFDNYRKYKSLIDYAGNVDFFVFGIVDNDLMLNNDSRYKTLPTMHSFSCKGPFAYAPEPGVKNGRNQYSEMLQRSFDPDYGNICLLNQVAQLLPKTKAIYMSFDYRGIRGNLKIYKKILEDHGLRVVSPQDFPDTYRRYQNYKLADFHVSSLEKHPSALANRMYAEMLLEELARDGILKAQSVPTQPGQSFLHFLFYGTDLFLGASHWFVSPRTKNG